MTLNIQSESFITAYLSYAVLKFGFDINFRNQSMEPTSKQISK